MDYIKIKGFKSIKDTYIEIAPINILIGANGSGKSNFISFFDFIHAIYNLKLNEYTALKGGGDKILHKGKKITNELSFKIEFDSGNNGYEVNMKFGDDGFVITRENLIYKQDNWIISTSSNETKLKYSTIFRAKYIKNYLNGFRRYHFHDTGKNSPFSNYSNIENDSYFFYTDGSNIGAFLYKILNEDKSTYKKIIKNIKSIAPYFSDFYLVPNKEKNIRLQWNDIYSDTIYGANDFSDGTLRYIALSILFLQPNLPHTIIIDEPELGLHPTAISKLSGMIKIAASKNCQIIIATQSADLIKYFNPENIIKVDQENGESNFKRLSNEELKIWLENYTLDDLWKRNLIQGGQVNYF